jgi:hypothetical protein
MNDGIKRLKCKKQFGVWYYKKIMPTAYSDLDAPIYELYDKAKKFVGSFGCYDNMKEAVEYGDIEEYLNKYAW